MGVRLSPIHAKRYSCLTTRLRKARNKGHNYLHSHSPTSQSKRTADKRPRIVKEISLDEELLSNETSDLKRHMDSQRTQWLNRHVRRTVQTTMSDASLPTASSAIVEQKIAASFRRSATKSPLWKEPCGGCGRLMAYNPGGPFCNNPHNKHVSHPHCKTAMHMFCRLCSGDRVETAMPELSPEHQELFEREFMRGLPGMNEPDHFPGMESLFKALSTVSHAQLAACLMERIRHEVSTDSMMNVAAETARAGSGASQVAAARTLADVANAVARTVSSTAAAVTYASTPVPPVSSSTSKNIVSILTHAIVILELAEPRSPVAQDRDELPVFEESVSDKGTAIPAYGMATSYAMISILFKTYLEVLPAKNIILPSQVSDAYIHILSRWVHGHSLPKRPMYVTSSRGLIHSCEVCAMRPNKPTIPHPESDLAGKVLHHRARKTHRALAGGLKEVDDINESVRIGLLALLKMCLADHRRRLQYLFCAKEIVFAYSFALCFGITQKM
ncbi:uncharacterized protein LOC111265382 isoform X5 [Varroa jacobsoni]|uniref:uncharacterized protein LOC111265382 isoform X5 n=1 Tax=Varroa jacobsoni TaxID=62625 RepID=UPI000BF74F3E|nr:uncharacterized protein LOC111265382 isoform X5 [Varroa jacobsoni]